MNAGDDAEKLVLLITRSGAKASASFPVTQMKMFGVVPRWLAGESTQTPVGEPTVCKCALRFGQAERLLFLLVAFLVRQEKYISKHKTAGQALRFCMIEE